ncbi:MAG TPA: ABC transporter permease [Pseudonocardiaceae bacterium]|nr:ABC transporter permease [Pseudonocardiaceae bacterium]
MTTGWPACAVPTQVRILAGRSLRGELADWKLVFFGLLQPVVLLVLFSQVFRVVGGLPGLSGYAGYVNFLVPATLVTIALTTAMGSGAGLLAELYGGFTSRLRCMPVSLLGALLARTIADSVRLAAQLVVVVVASFAVLGFRPAGGVLGAVAAMVFTVFFGWCLDWVFVALTTMVRKVQALQAVAFIVTFPLMFASSAYMPIGAMPAWMRIVARINPVTYAVDATRALSAGTASASAVLVAAGAASAMAVLGGVVAARTIRR